MYTSIYIYIYILAGSCRFKATGKWDSPLIADRSDVMQLVFSNYFFTTLSTDERASVLGPCGHYFVE